MLAKRFINRLLTKTHFILVLSSSLFFIISFCFLISFEDGDGIAKVALAFRDSLSFAKTSESFYPTPVLKDNSKPYPLISAQGALAIDLNSRIVLYEKNPDMKLLPASTTKIITALVAVDSYKPGDVLVVPNINVEGQKMGLKAGEKITAENLFKGLLIYSANDAAETLAGNYVGGRDAFIEKMNSKSAYLHLKNTHFDNPVGFDGNSQYTTAKDLIFAAEAAMKIPFISNVVGAKEEVVKSVDGKIVHYLRSTNELLGENGVIGVKTGWTESARENFVALSQKDGKRIMVAVLGSQDRFGETRELLNWIYESYDWQEVKPKE